MLLIIERYFFSDNVHVFCMIPLQCMGKAKVNTSFLLATRWRHLHQSRGGMIQSLSWPQPQANKTFPAIARHRFIFFFPPNSHYFPPLSLNPFSECGATVNYSISLNINSSFSSAAISKFGVILVHYSLSTSIRNMVWAQSSQMCS